MGKQPSAFERYRTHCRVEHEKSLAKAKRDGNQDAMHSATLSHEVTSTLLDHVYQLRLTESVLTKLHGLVAQKALLDSVIAFMREPTELMAHAALWIELSAPTTLRDTEGATELLRGMQYIVWYHPADQTCLATLRERHPSKHWQESLKHIEHMDYWVCDVLDANMQMVYMTKFQPRKGWTLYGSPFCEHEEHEETRHCPRCLQLLSTFFVLVYMALLSASGAFREVTVEQVSEQTTRKVNVAPASKKPRYQSQTVERVYRVVHIDADVQTLTLPKPAQTPRGSWLAHHEAEEIAYIEQPNRPQRRVYRHARYKNVRGMEIVTTPRKPTRRIPTLKNHQLVHEVSASLHEQQSESEYTNE